ncbi:MAG: hypothetical protein NUV60_03415 [Patescibacteria group bacterium]|nr:hypothetical protein [Patescibacteria group bacterium]
MLDQPLQPFSPPDFVSDYWLPFQFKGSLGVAVEWVLYAVFIFWAIYTLVAIYHWLKYSHASWIAFPAMAVHLLISFVLISYTLSGSSFFFTSYLP